MPTTERSTKLVVTSQSGLHIKYGSAGLKAVQKALAELVKADKARGIDTSVVYVDQPKSTKSFKAPAAPNSTAKQVKASLDALDASASPDYFTILGSVDVIPHMPLDNPAFDPSDDGDPDQIVPSDLPYACDAAYSARIADFVAPSRVVTRLPDVTGATDAAGLVALIKAAAGYKPKTPGDYASYLAVSAEVWTGSTRKSLQNIFADDSAMLVSPPKGPGFTPAQMKRLAHFINCHGAAADFRFYGQKGEKYPIAHRSDRVEGKISAGTVVAAECCYGAELYAPGAFGVSAPMCNAYLNSGAYGYLGSTTIAYGSSTKITHADVVCASFMRGILGGASIGRSALEARQKFVAGSGTLDPIELKTLGQFIALGDSSLHPVTLPAVLPKAGVAAKTASFVDSFVDTLGQRRDRLRSIGVRLKAQTAFATKSTGKQPSAAVKRVIAQAQAALNVPLTSRQTFSVQGPKGSPWLANAKRLGVAPVVYHLAVGRDKEAEAYGVNVIVGVVVGESGGEVVTVRDVFSR